MDNEDRFIKIKKFRHIIQLKNTILFSLILIDLFFIFSQAFVHVSQDVNTFINLFDLITCFCLFLDLVYEYKNSNQSILSFIKSNFLEIISIIPLNLIYLRFFAIFRLLRILRLYRMYKSSNISKNDKDERREFLKRNLFIATIVFTVIYFIVISLFLEFFDPSIENIIDAVWFNLVTITTVGYGDLIPTTVFGKLTTILSVIVGAFFLSIFTSYLSAVYNEKPEKERRERIKLYIDNLNNDTKSLQGNMNKLNKDIEILEGNVQNLQDKTDDILIYLKKRKMKK